VDMQMRTVDRNKSCMTVLWISPVGKSPLLMMQGVSDNDDDDDDDDDDDCDDDDDDDDDDCDDMNDDDVCDDDDDDDAEDFKMGSFHKELAQSVVELARNQSHQKVIKVCHC